MKPKEDTKETCISGWETCGGKAWNEAKNTRSQKWNHARGWVWSSAGQRRLEKGRTYALPSFHSFHLASGIFLLMASRKALFGTTCRLFLFFPNLYSLALSKAS